MREGDVYLLLNYETKEEIEKWLKRNFDEIFTEQLQLWYTDESMWPQKRNFKLFGEWFSYSLHTMIFDTLKGLLKKFDENMFNDINTDN